MTCIDQSQEPVTKEELLKAFSPEEQAVILSVPAAADLTDLAQLVRFSKYWRGEHHIEEMMYLEVREMPDQNIQVT